MESLAKLIDMIVTGKPWWVRWVAGVAVLIVLATGGLIMVEHAESAWKDWPEKPVAAAPVPQRNVPPKVVIPPVVIAPTPTPPRVIHHSKVYRPSRAPLPATPDTNPMQETAPHQSTEQHSCEVSGGTNYGSIQQNCGAQPTPH